MRALIQDATCPDPSATQAQKEATKVAVATKGLTAAGASLLSSEYVESGTVGVGNRMGDGSDRPLRDGSGGCGLPAAGLVRLMWRV